MKKKCGGKNVHPDRVQVSCPAPKHIFFGKKTGLADQPFRGFKKLAVKMGDIVKKMGDQPPN